MKDAGFGIKEYINYLLMRNSSLIETKYNLIYYIKEPN